VTGGQGAVGKSARRGPRSPWQNGLGQLRVRELSIGILDRHLRLIADQHGTSTARTCRSVLSGMCAVAARHDALSHNPLRALGALSWKPKKAPRALTLAQLRELPAALTYDDRALARDVPDLVSFLMATGLRISEACGLTWDAVDVQAGTIEVRAAAVRVRGQGLLVKTTKTDAGTRTLVLPSWCTTMLRDRAALTEVADADWGGRPVFPAPSAAGATLQHPSRPPRRLHHRRLRLGHLPRLPQNGHRHGPGRTLPTSSRRPARPRQHRHDHRRVFRKEDRGHWRSSRTRSTGDLTSRTVAATACNLRRRA
jgi:integrase